MYETLAKYLLEGLSIAFIVKYLFGNKVKVTQILSFTVTVVLTFMVLRLFAPRVLPGAHQGTGFGLGMNLVGANVQIGAGEDSVENFMDDPVAINYYSQDRIPTISEEGQPIMNLPENQRDNVIDLYTGAGKTSPCKRETVENFMDDPVAIDYYSKDRIPTISETGQPVMHLPADQQADVIDLYNAAQANQVSMPRQVNVLERFMDDKMAREVEGFDANCKLVHQKKKEHMNGVAVVEPFEADNTTTYQNYKKGPGQTAAERGLVYGKLQVTGDQKHLARIKKTLYSGDLVHIADDKDNRVAAYAGSNFVRPVPAKQAGGLNNLLFKLRFQLTSGHSNKRMIPIKYGSPVFIMYNTDTGDNRRINHNGNLNLMNSGKDVVFKLVNAKDNNNEGVVSMADDILIARHLEGQEKVFLKVNASAKTISTTATAAEATKFRVSSQKGCGPLWRFDSDTRGTNLFNANQVNEIVSTRTQTLKNQMEAQRLETDKSKK